VPEAGVVLASAAAVDCLPQQYMVPAHQVAGATGEATSEPALPVAKLSEPETVKKTVKVSAASLGCSAGELPTHSGPSADGGKAL